MNDPAYFALAGDLDAALVVSSLATVSPQRDGELVTLPAHFAVATVSFILELLGPTGEAAAVIEGPDERPRQPLRADEWALLVPLEVAGRLPLVQTARGYKDNKHVVYVYPRHTLLVRRGYGAFVMRALESTKPDPVDKDGRPVPWAPPVSRPEFVAGADERDADAFVLDQDEALPKVRREAGPSQAPFIPDAAIREWFERFVSHAGFSPTPELSLVRGTTHRLGFVPGRVWFRKGGRVLRVHLETCPNADLAEILATIIHELAHPLAHGQTGSRAHDLPMKRAMVELAGRHFGPAHFAAAHERADAPYATVDAWLSTCLRAALRGAAPPRAKALDDDQTARLLGRLKKLRELASDQRGLPEGITATSAANDLITTHELGIRGVELAAIDPAQQIDRWIVFPDGGVWRRSLAHGIAQHFDVFSLAMSKRGRMHYFGTYADVVAAEYLYDISAARIDRACSAHIERWKAKVGKTTGGTTRSEKISFCDSAVAEFRRKLAAIRAEDRSSRVSTAVALEAAEAFAWREHSRRGLGWSSTGTRTYRENAAGTALGRTMDVVNGVDGGPTPRLK